MKFTKNLHLTQYQDNDHLSWRDRYNTDMRTLDQSSGSVSAYMEKIVDDVAKYHEGVEAEFKSLHETDQELAAQTSSVLAFAQNEVVERKAEDAAIRSEIVATTSSISSAVVESLELFDREIKDNARELNTKIDANTLRIQQVQAGLENINEATSKIPELLQDVSQLQTDVTTLSTTVEQHGQTITNQGVDIASIKTEIHSIDMRLETAEDSVATNTQSINDINTLLTDYQPTLATVSILKGRMDIVESNIEGLTEEVKPIVTKVEATEVVANNALAAAKDANTIAGNATNVAGSANSTAAAAKETANNAASKASQALTAANELEALVPKFTQNAPLFAFTDGNNTIPIYKGGTRTIDLGTLSGGYIALGTVTTAKSSNSDYLLLKGRLCYVSYNDRDTAPISIPALIVNATATTIQFMAISANGVVIGVNPSATLHVYL